MLTALLLLGLAVPVGASGDLRVPPTTNHARNAIVLLLDEVGWRDFTPHVPMPNTEALMASGLTFRRAYAMPACSPTRYAMLAGIYPTRIGMGKIVGFTYSVPKDVPTVAGVLSGRGVQTCLVGKWHLSNDNNGVVKEAPRVHGFMTWRAGSQHNLDGKTEDYGGPYPLGWKRVDDGVVTRDHDYNIEQQTDAAIDWWTATAGRKFLVLSYNAAHAPYQYPPAHLLPSGSSSAHHPRAAFEDMIQAVDTELGRLLSYVDLSDTTVFLYSDNGTPKSAAAVGQDPKRLKKTVWEGGVNVPLVVAGAGVHRRGETEEHVVHAVDVPATLCQTLGVPLSPSVARDSQSFYPLFGSAGTRLPRDWVFVQFYDPNGTGPRTIDKKAVIFDRFKLHHDSLTGQELLFDLVKDPGERSPLPLNLFDLGDDAAKAVLRARAVMIQLDEYDSGGGSGGARVDSTAVRKAR